MGEDVAKRRPDERPCYGAGPRILTWANAIYAYFDGNPGGRSTTRSYVGLALSTVQDTVYVTPRHGTMTTSTAHLPTKPTVVRERVPWSID